MTTSRPTPEYGAPWLPITSPSLPARSFVGPGMSDYEAYRAREAERMAYINSLPPQLADYVLDEQYEAITLPDREEYPNEID